MPDTVRLHRVLAMKREKVYRAFIEPDPMVPTWSFSTVSAKSGTSSSEIRPNKAAIQGREQAEWPQLVRRWRSLTSV